MVADVPGFGRQGIQLFLEIMNQKRLFTAPHPPHNTAVFLKVKGPGCWLGIIIDRPKLNLVKIAVKKANLERPVVNDFAGFFGN